MIQANAPSTIPLWHYNIETGHWEEEGSAELIDNHYVGKVSHFSFWNADVVIFGVDVSGRVLDTDGNPLANFNYVMRAFDGITIRSGSTNLNGEFSGNIPQEENIEISFIKINQCTNFSVNQSIGAFTENTILEDINLSLPDELEIISGRLLSCERTPAQNGYVLISSDEGKTIGYSNEDDIFNIYICSSRFSLIAVDYTNGFKSEPVDFELSNHENNDIGEVLLCNETSTYITMTYNGKTITEEGAIGYNSYGILGLYNENADSLGNSINLDIILDDNNEIIGTHQNEFFSFFGIDENKTRLSLGCAHYDSSESCNITVNITTAQPTGGYIIGTYQGSVHNRDSEETDVPISGIFKALSFL